MAELHHNPFHTPTWESGDSARLREFLLSQTGKRLIQRLRIERPAHPTGPAAGQLEARALSDACIQGYELCVGNIFDYLVTPADSVSSGQYPSQYPSLDDDAAWGDVEAALRSPLPEIPPNEADSQISTEPPIKK